MARVYFQTVQATIGVSSGHTVVIKRVYYTDTAPGVEKLVGDGGVDDPANIPGDPGAATYSLTYIGTSLTTGAYRWRGDVYISGDYSMFIDGSPTDDFKNRSIKTGEEVESTILNNTHRLASSGVHGVVGLVVGDSDSQTLKNKNIPSPTGIVKSDIGLTNVEDKSATTINDEITVSQIESKGFNQKNQSWIYQETWTTGAAETTKNVDSDDIISYLSLADNWELAPNLTIEFWVEASSGRWAFVSKTNVSINEKSVNGITVLDNVAITGLANSTRYRIQLVLASIEAPPV